MYKMESIFDFIRKNYGKLLLSILFVVSGPILINFIIRSNVGIRVEKSNDWIGFFGSYSGSILGGIIGALVAVFVAKMQIEKQQQYHIEQISEQRKQFQEQIERDKNQYKAVNRSYVVLQEITNAPFDLEGTEIHPNSRIILTKDYDENRKVMKKMNLLTSFYKITLFGTPDNIFDCTVKVILTDQDTAQNILIDEKIAILEKNEEVFIPLYVKDLKEVVVNKVEIDYVTVSGERIQYIYDPINLIERYYGINLGEMELLMGFNMRKSNWLYPKKYAKK
jgi:gas vesicle protein